MRKSNSNPNGKRSRHLTRELDHGQSHASDDMSAKLGATVHDQDDESLPSHETLALIAAASQKNDIKEALSHALALWHEAGIFREAEIHKYDGIELPARFPATLRDFLRLIVCAKTPADSTKRLRDFYREEKLGWLAVDRVDGLAAEAIVRIKREWDAFPPPHIPSNLVADVNASLATELIARIKKECDDWAGNEIGGWVKGSPFTKRKWMLLAWRYVDWWKKQKSEKARASSKIRSK